MIIIDGGFVDSVPIPPASSSHGNLVTSRSERIHNAPAHCKDKSGIRRITIHNDLNG